MKAPTAKFKIIGIERKPNGSYARWSVVERSTGRIVWTGKTFHNARTAHAAAELGVSYQVARRMGNA